MLFPPEIYPTILFLRNETAWQFSFFSFIPGKLMFCWNIALRVAKNRMTLEFLFWALGRHYKQPKYRWRHILWRHKSRFVAVSVAGYSFALFFLFYLFLSSGKTNLRHNWKWWHQLNSLCWKYFTRGGNHFTFELISNFEKSYLS